MGIALLGILKLHFLPFVFSMILTYLAIENINNQVIKLNHKYGKNDPKPVDINDDEHKIIKQRMSIITTTGLTLLVGSLLTWGIVELFQILKADNLAKMMNNFITILENLKTNPNIPPLLLQYIPENIIHIKEQLIVLLKEHLLEIGKASKAGIIDRS